MKAALLVQPGELIVDEVPDLEPGPGEVRIAVGGVGLCGSDMSVFSGKWTAPAYPWQMGHEAFGTVDSVGAGVPETRLGETVVLEPNIVCFECVECRRGRTSACLARQSVGMNRPGALAEQLVVPSRFAWPISASDPSDMVCVEPMTVVEAALRRLEAPPPPAALVIGAGPQGLLMCLALIRRGVAVSTYEVNADRLAFSVRLGARAASPDEAEPRFDLVVDSVGSPESTATALARIATGGTLLVLGLDARPFEITAQMLVRRQLVLRGSLTYDHPADFRDTVALVAGGGVRPGQIVTEEYPLDEVQSAFDRSPAASGKTWIRLGVAKVLDLPRSRPVL